MKLKNLVEFVNESYTTDYLATIITKLKNEGKSDQDIFTYLDILNIPRERILRSIATCGCGVHEAKINEEGELEDLIDDVDDDTDKDKEEAEEEKPKEEESPEEDEKYPPANEV